MKSRSRLGRFTLVAAICTGIASVAVYAFLDHHSPKERVRLYEERGAQLMAAGDNARAALELRSALEIDNKALTAWRSLAEIEASAHHGNALLECLRQIVKLDPNDLDARLQLARIQFVSGAPHEALGTTEGAPGAEENAKLLGLKAAVLMKLKQGLAAVSSAKKALVLDPTNPDALLILAEDRMDQGDAEGALNIIGAGQASSGVADLGLELLRLKIYEQLREPENTKIVLQRLVASHLHDSKFYALLIRFYLGQHRDSDAEKEGRALVAANPTDEEAESLLVRVLYLTKGSEAAKRELVARIGQAGPVFRYQIALANLALANGDVMGAEEQLRDLVDHPESADDALIAKLGLAEVLVEEKKVDSAEALLKQILDQDPRNPDGLRIRASIRMGQGQLEAAIADLDDALKQRPQSSQLLSQLAVACERNGDIERADKLFSQAVQSSKFDPTIGIYYVRFLQRRGQEKEAEQILRKLTERAPKRLELLSDLAQTELDLGNWAGARDAADSLRNLGTGGQTAANEILGAALVGESGPAASVAQFESAAAISPTALRPMASLISALVGAQRIDKAVAYLQSTIAAGPANAGAWILLGSVQAYQGARKEAAKSFASAVEAQPENAAGYLALANFHANAPNIAEALATIRSGLRALPEDANLRLALAGLLERDQQYEAAITEYEKLIIQQPGSLIIANNLASLLASRRSDEASLDRAQALSGILRKSAVPQFKDTLGWISYRKRDFVRAVLLLEEAASRLPQSVEVRYHLAMAYIAIGEITRGADLMRAVSSLPADADLQAKIRGALASALVSSVGDH